MSEARVMSVDYQNPDASVIAAAASTLHEGGLVVAPTESRYGFMATADNAAAVDRLYKAKRRSVTQPTAVFVSDAEEMGRHAMLTASALALAERFLPGPLTLVLESKGAWKEPIAVDGKIAFRVSSAPFMRLLMAAVGEPLTATSANRSGDAEVWTIADVLASLGGEAMDLCIDAGRLDADPSTVIDCSGDAVRTLREGAVPKSEINSVLDGIAANRSDS